MLIVSIRNEIKHGVFRKGKLSVEATRLLQIKQKSPKLFRAFTRLIAYS